MDVHDGRTKESKARMLRIPFLKEKKDNVFH
jgi:hypothetical protein